MSWLQKEEQEILLSIRHTNAEVIEIRAKVAKIQDKLNSMDGKLDKILAAVIDLDTPPQAVSFTATVTIPERKNEMSKGNLKATADLQVNEVTGTFKVTLGFKDADGAVAAVPTGLSVQYTPSDATPGPSFLNLTPSADQSSADGSVNQDVAKAANAAGQTLPTGLTVGVTATWDGLAAPQSVLADPAIDVTPGPASTFVATEA